jgi:hypothetical protein
MPKGTKLDRNALHRILYRRTDHFDRIKVDLRGLAEETGLDYYHLSTVLNEFAREGRLHRIAGLPTRQKTYKVENPAAWDDRR